MATALEAGLDGESVGETLEPATVSPTVLAEEPQGAIVAVAHDLLARFLMRPHSL